MGEHDAAAADLDGWRAMYEPYLETLSANLVMPLPPWSPDTQKADDWATAERH